MLPEVWVRAGLEESSPAHRRVGKRIFDLVAASVCLLLISPLLAVVAVLVLMTTPGGAFFRQNRLGQYGRPFVVYKFRTMYRDCTDGIHREYIRKLLDGDEPSANGQRQVYKLVEDPRITKVGRVLRRLSIDELPQLINVIRGEMSLVGPRPALPWEADMFEPAHYQRFLVPPGLTGLWQVSGRNTLTLRQALELDIEYVQKQSFALDLAILIKTVPVVLSTQGAV